MTKIDEYREALRLSGDIRAFLLENSNLPGPRGNLELAHAASIVINAPELIQWCDIGFEEAPVNSPEEFLSFCGVLGQGRLYLEGDLVALDRIRRGANDKRWRTREAAAMALQAIGKEKMATLYQFLPALASGSNLEQRCAVAAICEPILLKERRAVLFALELLDGITASFSSQTDRKNEGFIALKKGLGYGWSVAASASFIDARPLLEKWLQYPDKDVNWVMQENLKKNRLIKLDNNWVNHWKKW
jgi:hypothetical protein